MYKLFLKRMVDFTLATIGFVIAFPLFLITAILLLIVNDGKCFFFQLRPGLNGEIFKIIKFKTMNDRKDKDGNLLSDEIRLTPIGKMVRKLSLDEIPQLLNVIMGDMSLVGPRPLLVEYLPLYSDKHKHRHDVRPGITGWAQVNGRNAISWGRKFDLDIEYVNTLSFLLDVKIILLTVKKVFVSEGISSDTSATMEKFIGYK